MSRARDLADRVLHNRTHEDTEGGRESIVTFKGEQSGGEISTLAQIQASHDGTSDDEKADLIFKTNDGSDGASPTTRMVIDSAGDVGIGAASSYGRLSIFDDNSDIAMDANGSGQLHIDGNGYGFGVALNADGAQIYTNSASRDIIFGTNETERMRITDGDVGIGTSSPSLGSSGKGLHLKGPSGNSTVLKIDSTTTSQEAQLQLTVDGTDKFRIAADNSTNLKFVHSGIAERMRITSDGGVLVGTTSSIGGTIQSNAIGFSNSGNNNWKKGAFVGSGSFGGALSLVNDGGQSDGFAFYLTGSPSTLHIQRGANNGTMANGVQLSSTATSWAAYSDSRLKTVTSEISNAIQSVNTLRAVKYTLDADPEETPRVGLIAQEVEAVLPEAVDVIDDDGHLGLRYTEVIPLLVAAVKELSTKVTTLETQNTTQATQIADLITRVTALEAE